MRTTRTPMVVTAPGQAGIPIAFCNEASQTLTAYDRDEIIGRRRLIAG